MIADRAPTIGDIAPAMEALRRAIRADRRVLSLPEVKAWCRHRWQYLFLEEAIRDQAALSLATRRGDSRPERQRIAEYFLVDADQSWRDAQPAPWNGSIRNVTIVFCPGMLNGMLPVRAFRDQLPELQQRFSMRTLRADSNPLGSCQSNTTDLLQAIDHGRGLDAGGVATSESGLEPPGDIMLIGYSKGGPDILTLLGSEPRLARRIRCAFFWSSPLLGTPAADDAVRLLENYGVNSGSASRVCAIAKKLVPGFLRKWLPGLRHADEFQSFACTQDLTTSIREGFMRDNQAALSALAIPMFSVAAATNRAEVPLIQRKSFIDLCQHDKHNDMQVVASRAHLPLALSTDLPTVRGHHWDIAYPAFIKRRWWNNMRHDFPKMAALTAMVQFSAELGLID